MNYKKECDFIIEEIKNYFKPFETKKAILGISGGKDSTICAMLLGEAIGYENVIGVMMPNGTQTDISDSYSVCDILKPMGFVCHLFNIEDMYKNIVDVCDVTKQASYNVPPRLRMTVLRAIGQSNRAKLVCTGNSSELLIGWCTLDGDMAHDKLAPLLNYTCIEVIEIGKELVSRVNIKKSKVKTMLDLVTKIPSDGLTGKSDEDNFGFTYQRLHDYERNGTCGDKIIDDIIRAKVKLSEFKRNRTTCPYTTFQDLEVFETKCEKKYLKEKGCL